MEPQRRLEEAKFPSSKEKFLLPSAYMGAKMKKGIYKGFRYFSNIFDPKEQEMQIGYPTNVKHVAHIGWEGPSENAPSWMNDFRSAPLTATVNEDPAEIPKFPSSEFILTGEPPLCLVPKSPEIMKERAKKPPRRKKSSNEAAPPSDSPKRESPSSNHPRRRQSRSRGSGSDSADGSNRGRRESEAAAGDNEAAGIPKQSSRRRTKCSSSNSGGSGDGGGGGSTQMKPAKGWKEEITGDFLGSARSPLTSS